MIPLSINEIASAVGGIVRADVIDLDYVIAGAVTTDSREISRGGIFVAKVGENDDGHRYLAQAEEAGAALAIVELADPDRLIPQIVVPNSITALSNLAAYVLAKVRTLGRIRVVGITGSNGKTSTKNMLAAILASVGNTVSPIASYNNLVGAPLTMLRVDYETQFLVVEMGAAGYGSIERLARIANPEIGIELKVGLAHAGVFGGLEQTKKIKAELLPFVSQKAVLNADDPNVMSMPLTVPAVTFGFDSAADYWISNPRLTVDGTQAELHYQGQTHDVHLQILGEHQLYNATAAVAAAHEFGVDIAHSLRVLSELKIAERWRMQPIKRADGVLVINDAYNSSPDSMKAALQTLATLGRQGHRTVAVLGEMAELGELAADEHDAIGRLIVRYNIDQLFVIGQRAKLIHMAAAQEGSWDGESVFIEEPADAVSQIGPHLRGGDVVLVKSSNNAGLRFIGDQLAEA